MKRPFCVVSCQGEYRAWMSPPHTIAVILVAQVTLSTWLKGASYGRSIHLGFTATLV